MTAITTFATLKTAVSAYHPDGPRTDIDSGLLADFFLFTQSKMYRGDTGIQPLRIQQMVSSATLTPSSAGVVTITSAVNSGWLEFIELTPTYTGARPLDYVEPHAFRREQNLWLAGAAPARIYTIEGNSLIVSPPQAATIVASWYQKFTTMSADSDTDWVLLNAPQVYLNGMLAEACAYSGTLPAEEAGLRAKFAGGIAALNLNDKVQRSSGSPKIARPRVVV